jgi:hypothetical protein
MLKCKLCKLPPNEDYVQIKLCTQLLWLLGWVSDGDNARYVNFEILFFQIFENVIAVCIYHKIIKRKNGK